jgi:hypothetical protein
MAHLQLTPQQTMRTVSVFAILAFMPPHGSAQSGMSRAEAAPLYTAAGFAIANDQPVNRCGQRARPRVSFIDLNADKRPEALFVDEDARCYAPSGRYFAVLAKEGSAWRTVISGTGSIQAQPTRTAGWLDMRVIEPGCTRDFRMAGRRLCWRAAGLHSAGQAPARQGRAVPSTTSGCGRGTGSRHAAGWPRRCRDAAGRRRSRGFQGSRLHEAGQGLAQRLRRSRHRQLHARPHRAAGRPER